MSLFRGNPMLCVHQTTRVTPALEAGVLDHVWSLDEMCGLIQVQESAIKKIDLGLILKALGELAS